MMPRRISTLPDRFSRRGFLIGATATGLLVACGSDDSGNASPSEGSARTSGNTGSTPPDGPAGAAADGTYILVQRFPQNVQEPGPVRLPISLAASDGQLIQDGPAQLSAQITDIDGKPLGEPITATRRDVAPGPYYSFRTELADPGVYYLVVDGGPTGGAAFQIMAAGTVSVPGSGQPLPAFDTPTVDDARGVDPICTREPEPCPFHEVTLTDALAAGKPVVYIVGTPAFCQTGTCAPALESIIDVQDQFGDQFTFVHAEVYTDNTATEPAPAVDAAGLTYEPALFITDAAGVVIERLDAVWDQTELVEVLGRAS